MKDQEKYITVAIQELIDPEFEVTKQYLEVMKVEISQDVHRVARVDFDHINKTAAVYFHIKDERFYLVVNLSICAKPEVEWVWMESGHRVYLTAKSEILSYEELSDYFPFESLSGWSKGDIRKNGKVPYKFTNVLYEPNENEAFGLEEKLLELLKNIEEPSQAILKLRECFNAHISICRHQYISANAGIHLDLGILHRLSTMNLELDIDTYIVGNEIK